MLLGGPQNTIKSHLVFTALFCFAPFSVFSSRMSAPYWRFAVHLTGLSTAFLYRYLSANILFDIS
jgi:hypothetical protein